MSLFFSLLPIYFFGNLHCLGMCGPLVMMLGKHRFRYGYFFGRALSYSLAGLIAGQIGAVANLTLAYYHISALTSFLFGGIIFAIGIFTLTQLSIPIKYLTNFASINRSISFLILQDRLWPTFLFGFFTVALPCGQTLIVFSACALYGDPWLGMLNGFLLALFTSPSLFIAMKAQNWCLKIKKHYQTVMGLSALFIGLMAFFRGLADLGIIPHLVLNSEANSLLHIVVY